MVALRCGLCVLLLWAALPSAAAAQSAEEEAREFFTQGLNHAQQEAWVEALEAFRASVARFDRAATHLNIASVLLRLGRNIEARDELRALLSAGGLRGPDLAQAQALLTRARGGIRAVRLTVAPPEAAVRIDGTVREGSGAARVLEIDPGPHELEISAEGYGARTLPISVQDFELSVALEASPAQLHVRGSVPTSSISLDGEERGRGEVRLELIPGSYALAVTAAGYSPFERALQLTPGQRLEVFADLAALPSDELWQSPWFWVIGGLAAAALVGLSVGLAVGLQGDPQYDGGTTGDVLIPEPEL